MRAALASIPVDLASIRLSHLNDHVEAESRRGKAPASVKLRVAALRAFWRWACAEGVLEVDAAAYLEGPRVCRSETHTLSRTETRRLVFGPPDEAGLIEVDPIEARDRLIHGVAYFAGLRASEVGWLRLDDVQLDGDAFSVLIRGGKGADQDVRRLVRSSMLAAMLATYLEMHRHRISGACGPWLFPSRKRSAGGRLGDRQVQRIFHQRRKRSGIKVRGRHLSHHILRRSLVTHLLDDGRPLDQVRTWVRHQSVATTLIYRRPIQERRLASALMPRDLLLAPQQPPAVRFREDLWRELGAGAGAGPIP